MNISQKIDVDVVIAVHSKQRNVTRAVDSALADEDIRVRVTVVLHGIPSSSFPALEERSSLNPGQLRLVEFSDGISSPAGPFNHGLDLASAPFVAILGSDDFFEPGALSSWYRLAHSASHHFVFGAMKHQNGAEIINPRTRIMRTRRLHPVRDRLFERSAPLGLIRLQTIRQADLSLAEGLSSGEDIPFTANLVTQTGKMAYARKEPGYVIGQDAGDRVTSRTYSVTELLTPVWIILESDWFYHLPKASQGALVRARTRHALLSLVAQREEPGQWSHEDLGASRKLILWIEKYAPEALIPLPRSQRAYLRTLSNENVTPMVAAQATRELKNASKFLQIVPEKYRHILHRDGIFVRYLGYALNKFGI